MEPRWRPSLLHCDVYAHSGNTDETPGDIRGALIRRNGMRPFLSPTDRVEYPPPKRRTHGQDAGGTVLDWIRPRGHQDALAGLRRFLQAPGQGTEKDQGVRVDVLRVGPHRRSDPRRNQERERRGE